VALEKRASLDDTAVARLRKEWDELSQTMERLHSERDTTRNECKQACQERDAMQRRVGSQQVALERETTQKLEAESVFVGLAVDLAQGQAKLTKVKRNL